MIAVLIVAGIVTICLDIGVQAVFTSARTESVVVKTRFAPDTPIVGVNFLKGSNKENVMNIKATAPTNDTKITVDFSPAVDPKGDGIKENVNMATLYITSDAMGIITDNETISDEVQEVTVSTTASGLYVKNGKGNYVIVNMVGKVVSTGIITSDEQYISTPNMPNGIYMISIDQSKLLRSAHKTTVKFVK